MRTKGKANYGRSTGHPYLDLWAAVIRQAILDAEQGNIKAAVWLWAYEPAIAELAADKLLAQPEKT